jgi:hypothetical protein
VLKLLPWVADNRHCRPPILYLQVWLVGPQEEQCPAGSVSCWRNIPVALKPPVLAFRYQNNFGEILCCGPLINLSILGGRSPLKRRKKPILRS